MESLIPKDGATADYLLQGFSLLTAANPDSKLTKVKALREVHKALTFHIVKRLQIRKEALRQGFWC